MGYAKNSVNPSAETMDRCDIKVWSGDCRRSTFSDKGEKYLCTSCETISNLDHKVSRDIFPHVSGDYDNLS
jgi:hypothetical protein